MERAIPLVPDAEGTSVKIDGVTYRTLRRNAGDELLVAVSSLPLPAGAATAAKQNTIITALALIADLRGALADVADDEIRANIIASALPAGAAQEASLVDIAGFLSTLILLNKTLADVGDDELRVNVIEPLPAGSANIGDVDLASYGWTPVNKTGNYGAAQTDTTIWTPAGGKAIVLLGVLLTTDTAMTIQLESSNVDIIPPSYFAANGGAVISGGGPIWKGGANATLDLTSSAAGNHSVLLWGYEV